ncbi:MAG: DNA-methyltransferase [Planctomycetota bacterium]
MTLLARANALRLPLRDGSVHCVVTSPPHWTPWAVGYDGLGSEPSPLDYALALLPAMREVARVLRDDGTIWLHLGADKYHADGSLAGYPWTVARVLHATLGLLVRSHIAVARGVRRSEARPPSACDTLFLLAKSREHYWHRCPASDVWTVDEEPVRYGLFSALPGSVVSPCVVAGCPSGGLVLDPFAGTGVVPRVAERLGRRGVGFDLSSSAFGVGLGR